MARAKQPVCPKCGAADKTARGACRPCKQKRDALWAKTNPEKMRAKKERGAPRSSEQKAAAYAANPAAFRARNDAWKAKKPAKSKWGMKRSRAKELGLEFDLDEAFFENVPDVCPVLEIKLEKNYRRRSAATPEVDRIDPSRGYVKGNCRWISSRANRLKNNATPEELRRLWLDARPRHPAYTPVGEEIDVLDL